jgi:molecular chaperone HtpG
MRGVFMSQAFQVDLRGVVDLLSHHLYSSPHVYLRELLQNATDAIRARELVEPGFEGAIRLSIPDAQGSGGPEGPGTLVVRDDGIGLTEDEVHRFLATIGSTSKRDELSFPRRDFLGQFGIGLLSCFLVADEVTIATRSVTGAPAVRWVGRSDGSYSVERLDADLDPGTTVYLRPRPDAAELVTEASVRDLARHYGDLLPYPATLVSGGRSERLNGDGLPWRWTFDTPAERREALLAYGKRVFDIDFLDVVPLRVPVAELEGLAFVLPFSPSPAAAPTHRVYLKRMLLSDQATGVLPEWAFFVRCVIDAGELRPTASREALFEDEVLEATREALGKELRRYLVRLAATEPDRLRQLIELHHLSIKALAVHDAELLAMMARWLPFETSVGTLTLTECRRRSPVLRYTRSRDAFRQLAQVAAAQGLCIVNGGYVYDADLLELLPEAVPGSRVEVVEPADLLRDLDQVGPDEQAQAGDLLDHAAEVLRPFDCAPEVRRFEPATVPTLYAPRTGADLRRSIGQARDVNKGLWGDVLGALDAAGPDVGARLCLNWANPLVQRLARIEDRALRAAALELLYVQALLLGHHPLRARELGVLNGSLLGLLDHALDSEQAR